MSFNEPRCQKKIQDFYKRSPRMGYNIKAFKALGRQQPLAALDHLLTMLQIKHTVVGEKRCIIKLNEDPLSWRVWIAGPVPQKPDVLYAHCSNHVTEFTIDNRSSLVDVVRFILESKDEFVGTRDMPFRPRPQNDDELLPILSGTTSSRNNHFEEAERAVSRDCLLAACTHLFTPFGLQPRTKWEENLFFNIKYLQVRPTPLEWVQSLEGVFDFKDYPDSLVWIERLGSYLELQHEELQDEPEIASSIPSSDSSPWTRDLISTGILLFLHSHAASLDSDKLRSIPALLGKTTYLRLLSKYRLMNLSSALIFNLASPEDRLALVERVLLVRNDEKAKSDEASWRRMWHGKISRYEANRDGGIVLEAKKKEKKKEKKMSKLQMKQLEANKLLARIDAMNEQLKLYKEIEERTKNEDEWVTENEEEIEAKRKAYTVARRKSRHACTVEDVQDARESLLAQGEKSAAPVEPKELGGCNGRELDSMACITDCEGGDVSEPTAP